MNTFTFLSPAAQAAQVLDAYKCTGLAAALCALADQVAPKRLGLMHPSARAETHAIRAEILAIAAELEVPHG